MQTAQARNDQLTGRIDLPKNEFLNDRMLQPSIDVMYFNYLLYYDEVTCSCGAKWWRKKTSSRSNLCGICHRNK